MKDSNQVRTMEHSTNTPILRKPSAYWVACVVGFVGLTGLHLSIGGEAAGVLPGFPNVPIQAPSRTLVYGLTTLLACGVFDTVFQNVIKMRRDLQALAIVLSGMGFGVTIEVVAYIQPDSAELLEQRYHFAMQNLMATLLFSLTYIALRRFNLPAKRSALTAILDSTQPNARFHSHAVDIFVVINLLLFVAMAVFFYRDRFVHYRGHVHIAEFHAYAILIFASILVLWRIFRHAAIPPLVLTALQIGILMHFSGGMVFPGGERLYDLHFAGIRFDKYVHLVNGCAAGLLVLWIWRRGGVLKGWLASLSVVLAVLGLGAVVEIAEYVVYCTVPGNGVGGYVNNMQDLFSNLAGVLAALLIQHWLHIIERR